MTIEDLKIDPKFRDLIPKLTDAENKQLEENILADGRVKEPIVVWGNTIVDGHHRYYILKDHPEIPYEIEQKEFANEYAAMAWACANQLGRRNLSQENKWYLRGKRQESESMAQGGDRKSKEAKSKSYNTTLIGKNDMASKIAENEHINRDTIFRDEQYAKGVDIAEEIVPGTKETLMNGKLKVPKYLFEKISNVTPDKQRKAAIAISSGEIQEAKTILNGAKDSLEKYGLQDNQDAPEYSVDDLIDEISASLDGFINGVKTSVDSRRNILSEESMDYFTEKIGEIFKRKIRDFMEGFLNE